MGGPEEYFVDEIVASLMEYEDLEELIVADARVQ
jgi:hypothetical protein